MAQQMVLLFLSPSVLQRKCTTDTSERVHCLLIYMDFSFIGELLCEIFMAS